MCWASLPPFTQIRFFFFFHHSSSSSCYHSCYHSMGTISTAYARGMTATPSGGTQTTTPLLPLSLSPPHPPSPLPALTGTQVKLCFFSSFFRFFSDHWRDLFSPHAGSSNPHLSTVRRPSNLASPAATIAGTQVKICFFRLFFFRSFFDQCYRDPLYPTRRVLNPPASPPHNPYPHIPPLKPRKSPPPRRTQVVTSASPLRHAQVRCHHPVTVRKTRRDTAPTPSGTTQKPHHQPAATPLCTSPALLTSYSSTS